MIVLKIKTRNNKLTVKNFYDLQKHPSFHSDENVGQL